MQTAQERELIVRLQAGDDAAVQELADRYRSRIFQLAMRYMKNREDAEEVTQDVLLKVYRKVGAFRGDGRQIDVARAVLLVADVPLVFEDAQHRPHRRIARGIGQGGLDLGGGRAPLRIQNVDDLPLAAAQIEMRLTHSQWLQHAD